MPVLTIFFYNNLNPSGWSVTECKWVQSISSL